MRDQSESDSCGPHGEDAIAEVLAAFGLRSIDPDLWAGSPTAEGPGIFQFDGAARHRAGTGLFAKAHTDLTLDGVSVGHMKIALTAHAAAAMAHEMDVLDVLDGFVGDAKVPRVVARGRTEHGALWSVQEAVAGHRARLSPAALLRLTRAIGEVQLPEALFPTPGALSAAGAQQSSVLSTSHGDLIPANLLAFRRGRPRDSQISVVDWEWAAPKSMPGFDVCHHFLGGALARPRIGYLRTGLGIAMAWLCLIVVPLRPRSTILGYLTGMMGFYSWCAEQEARPPADEPVVKNAGRIYAWLSSGRRA